MKIILDTNVLISGIFFTGPPHLILRAWRNNKLELIVSEEIFQEYIDACERLKVKYPGIEFKEIIDLIAVNTHFYQPKKYEQQITSDPDDDKFIICALESGVKINISGDKHLLEVNGYQGIEIVSPSDFIEKYL